MAKTFLIYLNSKIVLRWFGASFPPSYSTPSIPCPTILDSLRSSPGRLKTCCGTLGGLLLDRLLRLRRSCEHMPYGRLPGRIELFRERLGHYLAAPTFAV